LQSLFGRRELQRVSPSRSVKEDKEEDDELVCHTTSFDAVTLTDFNTAKMDKKSFFDIVGKKTESDDGTSKNPKMRDSGLWHSWHKDTKTLKEEERTIRKQKKPMIEMLN